MAVKHRRAAFECAHDSAAAGPDTAAHGFRGKCTCRGLPESTIAGEHSVENRDLPDSGGRNTGGGVCAPEEGKGGRGGSGQSDRHRYTRSASRARRVVIRNGGHRAKVAENRPNAERRQRTFNCANVRFRSAVCRRTNPKDPRGQGGPTIDPAARFELPLIDEVPEEVEAASIPHFHADDRPALLPGTFRAPTILVTESEVPPRNRPGRPR